MNRHLARLNALWGRLIDVPDCDHLSLEYFRARALRALMLATFLATSLIMPAIVIKSLIAGIGLNFPLVWSSLGICAFNLLLYHLAGRGPRGMLLAGVICLPPLLVSSLVMGLLQNGIYDPFAFCCFSALVLATLLFGPHGIYATVAASVVILVALGAATVHHRIRGMVPYAGPHAADLIWTFTLCFVQLVVFSAVLFLLQESVHKKLLDDSVRSARAHKEADVRAAALMELDRVKTSFFNSISHEFRTPITLSLGTIEEALSDSQAPLGQVHRDRLLSVRRNDIRLLRLVNTLLEYARMEAGRHRACFEPVDLGELTTELCSEFRSAMTRAALRFVVDCPALLPEVYVDRDMWERVILNLLSNALKFTLEGEVEVTLRRLPDKLELRIRDTGVGIAEDDLPRLFQHFQQVHAAKARTREGSGIGLALVHGLVRLHGGEIRASSVVNKGTTFTVTLPLGRAHLPPDQVGAPRFQPSTLGAGPFVEEALHWLPPDRVSDDSPVPNLPSPALGMHAITEEDHRTHVVLADDNSDMRDYLRRLLSQRFSVCAVGSGEAVLQAARVRRPDLVLSDVMMPGTSGFELVRHLRADAELKTVPVVLLSARAEEDSAVQGLQQGADDYLIKPFSPRELLARVSTHLEMNRLRRESADAKEEFVRIVSHELRSPLSIVKGYAQMVHARLLRSGSGEVDYLVKMERAIDRMDTLVNDLVDMARIEAGKLTLLLAETDLRELCLQAADEHEAVTDETVTLELPGDPVRISADGNRICQVLGNLLNNASKYGKSDKPMVLSLNVTDAQVWIGVRDHGPGIAPEHLPHLFERFYTVARSAGHDRGSGGLGLGLYICREILHLHGGTIQVTSEVGAGATFLLSLPLHGRQA